MMTILEIRRPVSSFVYGLCSQDAFGNTLSYIQLNEKAYYTENNENNKQYYFYYIACLDFGRVECCRWLEKSSVSNGLRNARG
jgi:hypothetical protein